MNELQLALIAIGAIAVAGVWAYNKWQERRHRKLVEAAFGGKQPDVLLGDRETEPPSFSSASSPLAPEERREPVISFPAEEPVTPPSPALSGTPVEAFVPTGGAPGSPPAEWADEIADCVLRIEFAGAIAAPDLWALQSPWSIHLAKPLSWLGFDGRQWRRLDAHDAGSYTTVCAALQLADRRGAVADSELSVFFEGVNQLAREFAGVVELPARDQVLSHARALDEFCAGVDVQLGVNVVAAEGVFAGTKLRGLAEAAGLRLEDDGLFHGVNDKGVEMFTLGNLGTESFSPEAMKSLVTRGVTLSLDVPRVADGPAVFDRLVAVARQLAQGLGGVVVDGQGHPLADAMVAGIRAKVGELQQSLATHQIPAGGCRARRLFA